MSRLLWLEQSSSRLCPVKCPSTTFYRLLLLFTPSKLSNWNTFESSATQAQTPDQLPVAIDVVLTQVGEQATPTANELQQAASGVMISLVNAQMLSQMIDPCREQSYLDLRRPSIALVQPVTLNGLCLLGNHEISPDPFIHSSRDCSAIFDRF